jgi:lysozyme
MKTHKITSPRGIDLIKQFEGLRLTAYQDMVGVWTIGYGHTGPDVKPGLTITQQRAEQLLINDLVQFERGVNDLVTVQINQNQFDALVSFTYNLGVGSLQKSTLLRLLNAGSYQPAADEFPRWNRAGGNVVAGLARRRYAERQLFLTLISE